MASFVQGDRLKPCGRLHQPRLCQHVQGHAASMYDHWAIPTSIELISAGYLAFVMPIRKRQLVEVEWLPVSDSRNSSKSLKNVLNRPTPQLPTLGHFAWVAEVVVEALSLLFASFHCN